MTSPIIRTIVLAGFTLVLPALPALASFSAINGNDGRVVRTSGAQLAFVDCMTDDGYGRKRSCSASYKKEHPNWRGTDDCVTDDGYGRVRSCSASYKRKHSKN
jgi:hypothetical protein